MDVAQTLEAARVPAHQLTRLALVVDRRIFLKTNWAIHLSAVDREAMVGWWGRLKK